MLIHFDPKQSTLLVSTEHPLDADALRYLLDVLIDRFQPSSEETPRLVLMGEEQNLAPATRVLFQMVNEPPVKATNRLNFRLFDPVDCIVTIRHADRITNFEQPSPAEAAKKTLQA